jgi:hypothetical protein
MLPVSMPRTRLPKRQRSQALLELALFIPPLLAILLLMSQYAVLYMDYLAVIHVTRDAARWVSARPETTDQELRQHIEANLPTPLVAGSFRYDFTGATNQYPWYPRCEMRPCNARVSGEIQRVALTYDASGHVFLPPAASLALLRTPSPTSLPRYVFYLMVEPR